MFEVGVRRINLTIVVLGTEIVGTDTFWSIVSATETVAAITETAALFYVVTGLAAPVASLAVVWAPCMNCTVADSDPSLASSSSSEVGGGVVVAINLSTKTGYCISGG